MIKVIKQIDTSDDYRCLNATKSKKDGIDISVMLPEMDLSFSVRLKGYNYIVVTEPNIKKVKIN